MQVHQQGRVLDAAGAPLNGNVSLTFTLYPSATSAVSAWTETASLPVNDGYYTTELGGIQAIDSALLNGNAELWLAVSIGSFELSRSRLASVPYALSAQTADSAQTLSRTDCNVGDVLAWSGSEWACSAAGAGVVTTFTRWGRTACPAGTSTSLYAGWVLSGRYTDAGAAVDYLCGTETPEYSPFGGSNNANGHLLWGVEFEPTGHSNINTLAQREARCAVCEVAASTTLMIPTATTCPAGWTEQYQGVLAGTAHSQAQQTETICVDDNPESWGDTTNHNHGLIYAAEIERNSGMPSGYLQDREPACVVCTK
ncbi:MAG: hypothetical protein ACJAZO_002766 [Myxococcota bacterium]|jgi:hypothetical protein